MQNVTNTIQADKEVDLFEKNAFIEHGGHFDLSNYGCVLVSGVDKYNHNRFRIENNLGEKFTAPM